MSDDFVPAIKTVGDSRQKSYAFVDILVGEKKHLSDSFFKENRIDVKYYLDCTNHNFDFGKYKVVLCFIRAKCGYPSVRETITKFAKSLSKNKEYEEPYRHYMEAHDFPFYRCLMEGCE